MSKVIGDSPQKRTEQEWKRKAQEGKRTRGQIKLTGGASTSHRLTDFFDEFLDDLDNW